ncbi:MAG: pilus assembly protein TadG-related protein, partial [Pirellulaceae bacterium]
MPYPARGNRKRRRGNIVILMALMLVGLLGIIAFAVDLGVIATAKGQLQRTADAAALAGASALYVSATTSSDQFYALAPEPTGARQTAQTFAASNHVMSRSPFIELNLANASEGDIVLGRLDQYWDQSEPLDLDSDMPNSVQVNVRLA